MNAEGETWRRTRRRGSERSRETRANGRARDELKATKKSPKKTRSTINPETSSFGLCPLHSWQKTRPQETTEQVHECMHYIRPSGSLSFRRISKHVPEYMHATHTNAVQPQQCLTREVIDFDAWYTGVKNEVKLTVGCRLWKKSQ